MAHFGAGRALLQNMGSGPFQVDRLARILIKDEATQFSGENYHTACTDSRVIDAARALDDITKCPQTALESRIAYKVKDGQLQGLFVCKGGQRDATIAINIYLSATGRTDRDEVRELTRLGNIDRCG
ncbi:hypothetical protein F5Y12DRAFT_789231 [Xylaria sp. FL1777]|nr:hypothetical protein F5Y12DRAFT_789231 [Xylaria sp. FL1777]